MRIPSKLYALVALSLSVGMLWSCAPAPADASAGLNGDGIPVYEVDPSWPPELPHNWILGDVRGLFMDD